MKEKELLCEKLSKFITTNGDVASSIFKKELIDTGKMTNATVNNILLKKINLINLDTSALIWIYRAIFNSTTGLLPNITQYFEEIELKNADKEKEKAFKSQFPLQFNAIPLLQKDQYLLSLDIKFINELQLNGILEVVENMQRESEITVYNGQLISHVAYNDDKAREISDSLVSRNYWSDAIRLHLINDDNADYYYDQDAKKLIIKSGILAILDGQHRVRAMEYALIEEPSLRYDFPVILSVGTVKDGQQIIAQHEKLEPINKHTIKTYQKSVANDVFKKLENNDDIRDIYKFVDTIQKIQVKAGFILKGDMIDAIGKYYPVNNYKLREQSDLIKWLIEFFMEIAMYLEDDFRLYIDCNRWSVNRFVFPAFVWLSSELKNKPNWKTILKNLLCRVDWDNRPWKTGIYKPDIVIITAFREIMKNESP